MGLLAGAGRRCTQLGLLVLSFLLVSAGFAKAALVAAGPSRSSLPATVAQQKPNGPIETERLAVSGLEALSATRPSARAGHGMAYDVESGRLILFGGGLSVGGSDETWAFDFGANAWLDMSPTVAPPAREAFGMAYDAESDRIVIFGGWGGVGNEFSDTWAYDYNANTWTNVNPPAAPSPRWGGCMAYDAKFDRVIYVGGHFQDPSTPAIRYRETWAYHYNTNTWTNVTPAVNPSKSNWCTLAYDTESVEFVLFGGEGVGLSDETWKYNHTSNTWTDLSLNPRPPHRWFHAMAYDSRSDRIVLFGGETTFGVDDKTWTFDLNTNTWTDANPGTRPSARSYHAMAYDSQSNRVLLFGGDRLGLSNETWAYDVDTNVWTLMAPLGSGPDRPVIDPFLPALVAVAAIGVASAAVLAVRRRRKAP